MSGATSGDNSGAYLLPSMATDDFWITSQVDHIARLAKLWAAFSMKLTALADIRGCGGPIQSEG